MAELGKHAQLHQLKKLDEVVKSLRDCEQNIEYWLQDYKRLVSKRWKKKRLIKEEAQRIEKRIDDFKRYYAMLKSIDNEHGLIEYYNEKFTTWDKTYRSLTTQLAPKYRLPNTEIGEIVQVEQKPIEQVEQKPIMPKSFGELVMGILQCRRGYRVLSFLFYFALLMFLCYMVD